MKKVWKILRWGILSVLVIAVLGVITIVIYLENGGKALFSEAEWDRWIEEVNSAPALPDQFYFYYEQIYPGANTGGFWSYAARSLSDVHHECSCHSTSNRMAWCTSNVQSFPALNHVMLTLELEDHVSPKQCFSYNFSRWDFINNAIGVKSAARLYFDSELKELSDRQVISLIVMARNPALYNPYSRPELLDIEVDKVLAKCAKN